MFTSFELSNVLVTWLGNTFLKVERKTYGVYASTFKKLNNLFLYLAYKLTRLTLHRVITGKSSSVKGVLVEFTSILERKEKFLLLLLLLCAKCHFLPLYFRSCIPSWFP